jgi:molybdopterin synthase sulfur carrier subunit
MATVLVPTPLRRLTGGQAKVEVDGVDVGTILQAVDAQYPGVADKLLDDDGNIKRFINVFVNDSEIRSLQGMHTPVSPTDKVSIVPAMAGGQADGSVYWAVRIDSRVATCRGRE